MQDKIQKQILDAFFVVLRPIAKILLRYGIGYREFAEVAKTAFVDVATAEYGIRGRPTNISRVAVMSGLTRKEVRRIRDQLDGNTRSFKVKLTPMTIILHKWFSDDEFLDTEGRPKILPFKGDSASFSSLVKRFGGDIPPGAMRTELKRVGAVEEDDDGNITAVRRQIRPSDEHDNLCVLLMHAAYALISNIAHNTDPKTGDTGWAQKTAFTAEIRADDLPRIRRICNDRLSAAAESFDDLFMAYEKINEGEDRQNQNRPVVVSLFYFEEHQPEMIETWRE